MSSIRTALAVAAIALLFVSGAVRAGDQVIERWYDALLRADRSALAELLSEDARISLDDLDVVQNKEEDGVATVMVCYDFPGNRMLMQETFAISEGRITASSQAEVADTCDAW